LALQIKHLPFIQRTDVSRDTRAHGRDYHGTYEPLTRREILFATNQTKIGFSFLRLILTSRLPPGARDRTCQANRRQQISKKMNTRSKLPGRTWVTSAGLCQQRAVRHKGRT